jgi:GT2 family glycosyltransferase
VTNPKVSIIILNWNSCEDTIECIESLKEIDYRNYEIIIVDNASSGDDVKILQDRFGDYIHIIANGRNEGFAGGCNIGMHYALEKGTDYILQLNNDTIVDARFLSEMIKVAEDDSAIGITGSKIYYYRYPSRLQSVGGKMNWWLGQRTMCGWDEEDTGQYDTLTERDFVIGTSLLVKKIVIDKISFLDNINFFCSFEDIDYCTRAKRAGFKIVYVPESKIWHKYGASFAKLPQYEETDKLLKNISGNNNYKYFYHLFRKHCPPVLFIFPFLGNRAMAFFYRTVHKFGLGRGMTDSKSRHIEKTG